MQELDDLNFDGAIQGDNSCKKLVLFTATTCQRCEVAKPIIENFLKTAEGISGYVVDITKGNTSELFEMLDKNNVKSLPAYAAYDVDGRLLALKVGLHSEEGLKSLVS